MKQAAKPRTKKTDTVKKSQTGAKAPLRKVKKAAIGNTAMTPVATRASATASTPASAAKSVTSGAKPVATTAGSTAEHSLPAIVRQAHWIWAVDMRWDIHNCYAQFRKTFELPKVPAKAPLCITADQSYQLYINGRYVCRGPARGFQSNWPCDELDVSAWLRAGTNCIAIRAYTPGLSNFQYLNEGYAGLLVAAQWGKTRILSDSTWKGRRQTGVSRDQIMTSLQLFPQESIDLRSEDPAWLQPDYDDSHWTDKVVSVVWNNMPWNTLEARGIPMLREEIVAEADCIGTAEGKSLPQTPLNTRNIAVNRANEGLAHKSCGGDISKPLRFAPSKEGTWRSVLIDFGKTVVGSVLLEISGAKGGEVVETFHAETIDEATLAPHFVRDSHCRMAFAHRLTCRKGKQAHDFYHTFGFRYMVLTVRDNSTPLQIRVRLRTTLYPHQISGSFSSSDAQLEAIWNTCCWTEQVCSMDAYVDTPWREQAQWWGDARVQAWNTFHMSGDERLLLRGIRQIAQMDTPTGITYGHAPTMAHNCILPDFTLIWICTLWDAWRQSGSLDAFLAQQHRIETALAYFTEWTNAKSGLLEYDPRYWLFLDWTPLQKDGQSSVYSLWLLYALDRLTELYAAAQNRTRGQATRQWATRLRTGLRKLLAPSGLLRDGILPSGKTNPHCSVHAQTLSLLTDLAPEHRETMLRKSLLPFVREQSDDPIRPSAYWVTYVYTVLGENGYGADVLAHIRRHWEPMVKHGTTWENWNPVLGNESFSHAWSAHPLFHLMQILGGVRQSAPGWKRIRYQPTFVGNHASISIPSPLGDIRSSWQRNGDHIEATLGVPVGMEAEILLPGQRVKNVGHGEHRFAINHPE